MILAPDQRTAWRKRILAEMHTMWRVGWMVDNTLQRLDYVTEAEAEAKRAELADKIEAETITRAAQFMGLRPAPPMPQVYRVSGYEHQEAS